MAGAAAWLLLLLLLVLGAGSWGRQQLPPVYHNQFAVLVPAGRRQADLIAHRHGFNNIGQIGHLPGYFLLEHQHIHKRSPYPSEQHLDMLSAEPEVHWVQQQYEKVRRKRDFPLCTDHRERKHGQSTPEVLPCPLFQDGARMVRSPRRDDQEVLAGLRESAGSSEPLREVGSTCSLWTARNSSPGGLHVPDSPGSGTPGSGQSSGRVRVGGSSWSVQEDRKATRAGRITSGTCDMCVGTIKTPYS